jgi:hypothetical protein
LRDVFDHEVKEPAWYFDLDAAMWSAPPTLTLSHVGASKDPAQRDLDARR